MKLHTRTLAIATTVTALALLSSCSPIAVSPTVAPLNPSALNSVTQSVYAFAPNKPLLARYADGAARATPISVLQGNQTQLSTGNGMALDSEGTIYLIVHGGYSSDIPLRLLVFRPNAHGNIAPVRTAILKGPVLPGYAVGLALDGQGNFWISAIGRLLRYPAFVRGTVRPNASIPLELDTPRGRMPAHASNVAVDSAGKIYCSCTVVFQGAQAIGVSEYMLTSTGKAKLVRSFYDFNLPEVPPSSIAVDGNGTIYLASSLPNTGVFAYDAGTRSGDVPYSRRFVAGSGTQVSSLTTDSAGKVYIAAGSRIMVFGSRANGHVRPLRSIDDPKHLDYTTGTYGTLLNVH